MTFADLLTLPGSIKGEAAYPVPYSQDARTSRLFSAKYMISWYFMIWVHNPLIQRSFSILPATGSQTASHQLDDISSSFSQGTQLILWRMSRRKCGAMSTQSIPTWQSCVPYESAAAFSWCQEDIMRTETWWSCLCLSNQCFTLSPKGVPPKKEWKKERQEEEDLISRVFWGVVGVFACILCTLWNLQIRRSLCQLCVKSKNDPVFCVTKTWRS